jgi:D-arabinose 1-dehydrogenase-like Zn-dependent alcohol dehydrogenase
MRGQKIFCKEKTHAAEDSAGFFGEDATVKPQMITHLSEITTEDSSRKAEKS